MICPSCEEHIVLEDYSDITPFQCEHCDIWLELDIDEGTYYGATHANLRIVDEDDL